MQMTGRIASTGPEALTLRMARHFAHKVPVEQIGATTRIETRVGTIELESLGGELIVRLSGEDVDRIRDVAVSHLERFARVPIIARWD